MVRNIHVDGHLQGTGAAERLVERLRDAFHPGAPVVVEAPNTPASGRWTTRMCIAHDDWWVSCVSDTYSGDRTKVRIAPPHW